MSMYIGEALAGEGNEVAHIDLLIGSKDGPVGVAFANALARQSEGHSNLLAVITPNLAVKPATVMVTKVTIKGAKQAVQMFGPAQNAVAKAVADAVSEGAIPKDQCEDLVIVCGVFIHWEAEDDDKIYQYNYEATKQSIINAMSGKPTVDEMLAGKDQKHPFLAPEFIDVTLAKILVQLDPDPQPSVFDSVVAIDAGVDHLLRHANVSTASVRDLVYGTIFTRGPRDLRHTAIFVGGSDVAAGEALLAAVNDAFLGPLRVSVLFDANGANTTAAAAVVAAGRHVRLSESTATVLAGTGPVGQRVARLLAGTGATVRVASRKLRRAQAVCDELSRCLVHLPDIAGRFVSVATADEQQTRAAVAGAEVVIGAGAPGVQLLSEANRTAAATLRVAIDLNAVPPWGLEGLGVQDKAADHGGVACYGALGVGGTKMKIHRAALEQLFTSNDQLLDAEQVYQIGLQLEPPEED